MLREVRLNELKELTADQIIIMINGNYGKLTELINCDGARILTDDNYLERLEEEIEFVTESEQEKEEPEKQPSKKTYKEQIYQYMQKLEDGERADADAIAEKIGCSKITAKQYISTFRSDSSGAGERFI